MKKRLTVFLGILAMAMAPFFVEAQIPSPVSFEVTSAPETVRAGESFEVTVQATIEGNWHLYSVNIPPDAGPYPTAFTSASSQMVLTDSVRESEAVIEYDPNFETELGWHSEEATFTIPVAFRPNSQSEGSNTIRLQVRYQVCNDSSCLPPTTKEIAQPITVTDLAPEPWPGFEEMDDASAGAGEGGDTQDGTAAGEGSGSLQQGGDSGSVRSGGLGSGGIFSFLWIALGAGFAALLTPCVFPMIPLTVSFFTKQKEGPGGGAVGQALAFGLAIVVTFTLMGALLALLVGASGANRFAANPWVNLFIAAMLVVFALSLLGAFELRLPHQLTNWLNRQSNESSGLLGVLFMALTISAVSFSCTAPFVGGVLAATAGGEWFYPIVGMAAFSAAFASPFVVLALFPRWMESLPKSGSWMNVVKVLLGFVELAAAVKFLSNADLVLGWGLVSRPLAIAAWIAIFLMAGLYVLGVYTLKHEPEKKKVGAGRIMLALPMLLFCFYLLPGLLGANLGIWDAWLPPKQASDVSVVRSLAMMGGGAGAIENEGWSEDYQASLERARAEGRPIFIDFTGYTCTNCRDMEANVFPLAEIQQRFDRMEKVKLYTDDGQHGLARQKFQLQMTGTVALPTYVVIDPASEEVLIQHTGMASPERFRDFLDRGLARFEEASSSGGPKELLGERADRGATFSCNPGS
ncbi:MAG: cytochrome c biogenesis protein CcdA [Balneolaceae bacterium]|nr:cytochrome c biogenesis protein CcdA [Balneolaceae bacterium]